MTTGTKIKCFAPKLSQEKVFFKQFLLCVLRPLHTHRAASLLQKHFIKVPSTHVGRSSRSTAAPYMQIQLVRSLLMSPRIDPLLNCGEMK